MSRADCLCGVDDINKATRPDCMADGVCKHEGEKMAEGKQIEGVTVPEAKPDQRVRMNFGMNAKGLVQMDLTVEFPTTAEAETEARKAIDAYRAICLEKNLKLADAVA